MKLLTIAEALNKDNGDSVPSIRGTITSIGKFNSGDNSFGRWTMQPIEIQDQTGKIRVKIFNHDALPESWKNRQLFLSCRENDKGKTVGLTIEEKEYRGKNEKAIKFSDGLIELQDGQQPAPASQPAQQASQPAPAPQPASQAQPAASQPTNGNGNGKSNGKDLDKAILAMGNVYLRCMDCATYIKKQFEEKHKEEGLKMTDDHFQGMSSTLFIAAQREGLIKF